MTKTTGDDLNPSVTEALTLLDVIELSDPDPRWPVRFVHERDLLKGTLGDIAITIDHIGSTAVPGLKAKPVIDIMLSVKDLELGEVQGLLEAMGYVHVPIDEMCRLFFRKGMPRTHHLHIVEFGGEEREKHLRFRDRLIAHPQEAAEYGSLKEELAKRFRYDREAYLRGKETFIQDILGR
ncbi:MAG: GrpB family protein [Methanomassiliicoccales archaeon]|nr:GrpB family protein [Methanomassiliicoccales archaeon]